MPTLIFNILLESPFTTNPLLIFTAISSLKSVSIVTSLSQSFIIKVNINRLFGESQILFLIFLILTTWGSFLHLSLAYPAGSEATVSDKEYVSFAVYVDAKLPEGIFSCTFPTG